MLSRVFYLEVQDLSRRLTQSLLRSFVFIEEGQDAQTRPGERMPDRVVNIKYLNIEGDLEKKKIV